MAAGLLKKMLKEKHNFRIKTAGVAAIEGLRPTPETVRLMSEQDVDVSDHRSSPLTDELIREADLILVMERTHKENILNRRTDAKNKVHLLSEFGRIKKEEKLVNPDIPDPVGKSLDFYRKVFDIIKESVLRTAKKLEQVL